MLTTCTSKPTLSYCINKNCNPSPKQADPMYKVPVTKTDKALLHWVGQGTFVYCITSTLILTVPATIKRTISQPLASARPCNPSPKQADPMYKVPVTKTDKAFLHWVGQGTFVYCITSTLILTVPATIKRTISQPLASARPCNPSPKQADPMYKVPVTKTDKALLHWVGQGTFVYCITSTLILTVPATIKRTISQQLASAGPCNPSPKQADPMYKVPVTKTDKALLHWVGQGTFVYCITSTLILTVPATIKRTISQQLASAGPCNPSPKQADPMYKVPVTKTDKALLHWVGQGTFVYCITSTLILTVPATIKRTISQQLASARPCNPSPKQADPMYKVPVTKTDKALLHWVGQGTFVYCITSTLILTVPATIKRTISQPLASARPCNPSPKQADPMYKVPVTKTDKALLHWVGQGTFVYCITSTLILTVPATIKRTISQPLASARPCNPSPKQADPMYKVPVTKTDKALLHWVGQGTFVYCITSTLILTVPATIKRTISQPLASARPCNPSPKQADPMYKVPVTKTDKALLHWVGQGTFVYCITSTLILTVPATIKRTISQPLASAGPCNPSPKQADPMYKVPVTKTDKALLHWVGQGTFVYCITSTLILTVPATIKRTISQQLASAGPCNPSPKQADPMYKVPVTKTDKALLHWVGQGTFVYCITNSLILTVPATIKRTISQQVASAGPCNPSPKQADPVGSNYYNRFCQVAML